MPILKLFNPQGNLFATILSFGLQALIKLGSSVVMTRLLRPEAWGVLTVLTSIIFVVEMIADLAVFVAVIRHERGDDPSFLNTAWTLRLIRAALNTGIVFFFAPLIAHLYAAPLLTAPLRVCSFWFLLSALESMSFPVAIRRKNSRIYVYSELVALTLSTAFTVVYSYYSRDYWGMVYGVLLNRLLMTLLSYRYYPELRPRLELDARSARELFRYTRVTIPSSLLTLALTQFDKIVFLRLFDLNRLGVYGLAGNIASAIEMLISRICEMVLYPRCAHDFRTNPDTFALRYYTTNTRLFVSVLIIPAAVGGAARLLIAVLYDPRYAQAGAILQAFMLRAAAMSLASPAEHLLIASGEYKVILVGNIFRAAWTVAGSLTGYYFFGFMGFVYGAALSGVPPLLYYLWLQWKKGLLMMRFELYKVALMVATATTTYLVSELLLKALPVIRARM